ncbi:hypothetical protein [Paenirhodobacter sp.]|uniref:hypothetical protein n=1 Tax=Paenirhodobacter sp. TaxID=1965326 RepID=UPI003B50818D
MIPLADRVAYPGPPPSQADVVAAWSGLFAQGHGIRLRQLSVRSPVAQTAPDLSGHGFGIGRVMADDAGARVGP